MPGMRKLLYSPWQTLGVPFALTPNDQLHQCPPSPVLGDLGRCPSHCFWQTSDSVCTTVLTVTLSTKKKPRFARFFCRDVHNKLENDLETNNIQTNVLDLTMRTLVMHTHAHSLSLSLTHTHTRCACVRVCVCARGRGGGWLWFIYRPSQSDCDSASFSF